jgi:hypothetical protein
MTDQQQQQQQPSSSSQSFGEVVVARAGSYYRNTRYLMALMCVGGAIWFGLDGWKNWPESNRKLHEAHANLLAAQEAHDTDKIRTYSEEEKQYKQHSDHDIWLQKVLACALPPVGVLLLAWSLYKSRGQYRLAGTTLSVPGHPEIRLDDITKIDKQKWDRKGIVYLHYTTEQGRSGVITLDDFLYDRPPTDEIFKRVEEYLLPAAGQPQQGPTSVA